MGHHEKKVETICPLKNLDYLMQLQMLGLLKFLDQSAWKYLSPAVGFPKSSIRNISLRYVTMYVNVCIMDVKISSKYVLVRAITENICSQVPPSRANLCELGEGPYRAGDILVLLCPSTLVLRGTQTSLSRHPSAGPSVAQESKMLIRSTNLICYLFFRFPMYNFLDILYSNTE